MSIPATVIMFSGCEDSQTSADVCDVTKMGLPEVDGPAQAGGACTCALLHCLGAKTKLSYGGLLHDMRAHLKELGYKQNPQMSSSKPLNLANETFDLTLQETDEGRGRTKALFIGINYNGHETGVLKGCVNDARKMKRLVTNNGFATNRQRLMHDEPGVAHGLRPTKENILEQLKWLVSDVKSGDSLFLHYSGHGTQVDDKNGDESDGKDEALVPCDYKTAGVICDDDVYDLVVKSLPAGAQLVAVMDCCHSGSILDLPHVFNADSKQ